ncbi:hypothetical protein PVL29_026083 [Vitis rotundifolia]|uniref:NTP pyrophosphohydrolase MazG putative catalytic core domain-containing protein n=1 Tax=Vitis rotundifolia TaxID=103349 RepID=A0AA39D6R2_VITRO|nr:hypothetical protein PVL29_026083 [Vitis rotundifolia]
MNYEEESVSLGLLKKKMVEFSKEIGELSEIFQWRGEEKQHLGKEFSDVLFLYLVRLSDICGIDLGKAVLHKVDPNAIKYPVSKTNLYNEGFQSH